MDARMHIFLTPDVVWPDLRRMGHSPTSKVWPNDIGLTLYLTIPCYERCCQIQGRWPCSSCLPLSASHTPSILHISFYLGICSFTKPATKSTPPRCQMYPGNLSSYKFHKFPVPTVSGLRRAERRTRRPPSGWVEQIRFFDLNNMTRYRYR